MSEKTEEKTIPYARFQELVTSRNAEREANAQLKAQIQGLAEKVATVDTLAAQLSEAKAAHEAERLSWDQDSALMSAGITDPEGRDIAKFLHAKLGDDRPKLSTWLATITAEGGEMPRALAAYMTASSTDSKTEPVTSDENQTPQTTTPSTTGRAPVQPGGEGSSKLTPAEIRAIRGDAMRTGDWSAWAEAKKNGRV